MSIDEVMLLLERVPEIAPRFLELAGAADDAPDAHLVFCELADHMAGLAREVDRARPEIERCSSVLEQVVNESPEAELLVGWGFLDNLSPDDLRVVLPWLGRATVELFDSMDPPRSG